MVLAKNIEHLLIALCMKEATALHIVSTTGALAIVQYLVEHGASINSKDTWAVGTIFRHIVVNNRGDRIIVRVINTLSISSNLGSVTSSSRLIK